MTGPASVSFDVLHSVYQWLPRTATWVSGQIASLPADVRTHVVCERVINADEFPHPRIHTLEHQSFAARAVDQTARRLGLRRHLRFQVDVARRTGAAVLHSHFGTVGWRDIGVAKATDAGHVVTFYGWDMSSLPHKHPEWRPRYLDLFDTVDHVLLEGEHMARALVDLGCPREKVTVHHLGVDTSSIPFEPRRWQPGQPLRVLMAAVFREKKGLPYGIEALGRIRANADIELTIIGDSDGGAASEREKQRMLDTLDSSGLRDRTRLLGFRSHAEMYQEAGSHHVFLSPSVTASDGDTEGGAPVSIIEMCASGMMVVSSRHCDIPGVVQDGVTGLLANERDVDELAAHVQWLIDNPGEWDSLLTRSREHIEGEFDAVTQGHRLADIYRRVAGERGR